MQTERFYDIYPTQRQKKKQEIALLLFLI